MPLGIAHCFLVFNPRYLRYIFAILGRSLAGWATVPTLGRSLLLDEKSDIRRLQHCRSSPTANSPFRTFFPELQAIFCNTPPVGICIRPGGAFKKNAFSGRSKFYLDLDPKCRSIDFFLISSQGNFAPNEVACPYSGPQGTYAISNVLPKPGSRSSGNFAGLLSNINVGILTQIAVFTRDR